MARRRVNSRKKRVDGFSFPTPFAAILVLVCTAALTYLYFCSRCDVIGEEIKGLEVSLRELNKKYLNEEYRWTRLKSPRNLEKALVRHSIEMVWPQRDQVVWLNGGPVPGQDDTPRSFSDPRVASVRRRPQYE
jgi:hypothetical protein